MKPESLPTRWFYTPTLGEVHETITLDTDESRHLLSALRTEPGASITLFDGAGGLATGRLVRSSRRPSSAAVCIQTVRQLPRVSRRVHLVSAIPKGDRAATMLDMAAQLGMTDFTPLKTERSIQLDLNRQRERWLRVLIGACKQSQSGWLPVIHDPITPRDLGIVFDRGDRDIWLCDRDGSPASSLNHPSSEAAAESIVVVGPEGGLTIEEKSQISAVGGVSVRLANSVLRIETAATAAVAFASLANLPSD